MIALLKLQGMLNSSNTGNRVKAICLPSEGKFIFLLLIKIFSL